MGEAANTTDKAPKKSWFKGLKAEFKKIIWSDKETLAKQSLAVVIATICLSVIIALVDWVIKFGIGFIIG